MSLKHSRYDDEFDLFEQMMGLHVGPVDKDEFASDRSDVSYDGEEAIPYD